MVEMAVAAEVAAVAVTVAAVLEPVVRSVGGLVVVMVVAVAFFESSLSLAVAKEEDFATS